MKKTKHKLSLTVQTVKPLADLDLSKAGGAGVSNNYPGQCTVVCPTIYKQQ